MIIKKSRNIIIMFSFVINKNGDFLKTRLNIFLICMMLVLSLSQIKIWYA